MPWPRASSPRSRSSSCTTRRGRPGPPPAPSCSSTSKSSTTASGAIRRSAISAREPSNGSAWNNEQQLNQGVHEIGGRPVFGVTPDQTLGAFLDQDRDYKEWNLGTLFYLNLPTD